MGYALVPTLAGLMEQAMRVFSALALVSATRFNGTRIETPLSWSGALLPCIIAYEAIAKRKIKRDRLRQNAEVLDREE